MSMAFWRREDESRLLYRLGLVAVTEADVVVGEWLALVVMSRRVWVCVPPRVDVAEKCGNVFVSLVSRRVGVAVLGN